MGAEVSHPSRAHPLAKSSFTTAGCLHSALGGEML